MIETVEKHPKTLFPERSVAKSKGFFAKIRNGLRQAQAIKIIFLQSHDYS